MKTCPVCGAKTFGDADTCFGCLHRFGEEPEVIQTPEPRVGMPAEFRIRFVPMLESSGACTWKCAVEV